MDSDVTIEHALGEDGFIFLDDRPWPYIVRFEAEGDWWLYYWADSRKSFVTMRKLDLAEVATMRTRALPREKAALYFPPTHVSRDLGDGQPILVQPCPKCGVAPSSVDDCGEFGNPACPYFGIDQPDVDRAGPSSVE